MKKISLSLFVFLPLLAHPAAAQSTLTDDQKRACETDIVRFCAKEFAEELKSCLQRNTETFNRMLRSDYEYAFVGLRARG
jgi:hypothetical protein